MIYTFLFVYIALKFTEYIVGKAKSINRYNEWPLCVTT